MGRFALSQAQNTRAQNNTGSEQAQKTGPTSRELEPKENPISS